MNKNQISELIAHSMRADISRKQRERNGLKTLVVILLFCPVAADQDNTATRFLSMYKPPPPPHTPPSPKIQAEDAATHDNAVQHHPVYLQATEGLSVNLI